MVQTFVAKRKRKMVRRIHSISESSELHKLCELLPLYLVGPMTSIICSVNLTFINLFLLSELIINKKQPFNIKYSFMLTLF